MIVFFDPRITNCFLYREAVDCRKGHNGLVFLITSILQKDLRSGAIYLFVSRDRKTAKAIKWDGSGILLIHKKMERGKIMSFQTLDSVTSISSEEITAILAGAHVRLDLKI